MPAEFNVDALPAEDVRVPAVAAGFDRTVVVNLAGAGVLVGLALLGIVADWLPAKGVLVLGFLSVALAYVLLPVVTAVRRRAPAVFGGWKPSRLVAVLLLYGAVAAIGAPAGALWGRSVFTNGHEVAGEVPRQLARFAAQVRANERWPDRFAFERSTRDTLKAMTRRASERLRAESSELGGDLLRARGWLSWLAAVPVMALLLIAQWPAFHRSAARALPTPHLKWRADEFFEHVNTVLAAYTRAQALSAVIVGSLCGVGFAVLRLPNAATLGLIAGALEMVPIAGPLIVAISATAVAAPSQVPLVLAFLGGLRIVQDYLIYPRLIRRAMRLHPVAVVGALWLGAFAGGIVGVCLAVPIVGLLQTVRRHYREYRAIERLVREHARVATDPAAPGPA